MCELKQGLSNTCTNTTMLACYMYLWIQNEEDQNFRGELSTTSVV